MSGDYDVAVVGGGLLGSAIAWGLGRLGKKVAVLDEGDITKRASRANFALVWVQSKGLGMPAYTVRSSRTAAFTSLSARTNSASAPSSSSACTIRPARPTTRWRCCGPRT